MGRGLSTSWTLALRASTALKMTIFGWWFLTDEERAELRSAWTAGAAVPTRTVRFSIYRLCQRGGAAGEGCAAVVGCSDGVRTGS
jgi:hypothetical protein